jgi:ABC-type nitrate/sulfonate/bicarbonate transport system substrate-binding protein
MALRVMLGRPGVAEPGEIDLVTAPLPSQGVMLEQGKIDLAALGPPFSYVLKSRGTGRTLFTLADALGSTDALMLVARAEFLARNRAALDDFFEDYVSARRWFLAPAHRDEAVRIVAQASRVPAELLDGYLFTDGDYFRSRDARPDQAALQRSLDLLHQAGFLDIAVDANTLCDPSFIDEAARRLK